VGHRFFWAAAFALASAGCGGHSLEVGSTDGGAAADVELTPDVNPFLDADPTAPEVWVGHFVNHQLPDGSDMLTLTVQFVQDGTITGTLLLGDGAVLAPPTDPNADYPPFNMSDFVTAVEGFPYTLRDGVKSGDTVLFGLVENEAWSKWCGLQTSYLHLPATDAGNELSFYSCNPPGSLGGGPTGCSLTDPTTLQEAPVGCGRLHFCDVVCQCVATGCALNQTSNAVVDLSLRLVLTGDVASGTTYGAFGSYAVNFKRTK
ncbi:MAG: hypothetical protein ACRENE_15415, partial [Polyangiaceae bacterium]